MTVTLYDRSNKRLVFLDKAPESDEWDNRWSALDIKAVHASMSKRGRINRLVRQHVKPADGPILEAGCGVGQYVFALGRLGYQCVGVDFAEATVQKVKRVSPELDIRCQDIRALQFEDDSFAAVCSFGVIEHFRDGYDDVLREMRRVTQRGGYLFLSFPHMSPLRHRRVRLGRYLLYDECSANGDFWQYALDATVVIRHLRQLGYVCLHTTPLGGLKGLAGEIRALPPTLRRIQRYRGPSVVVRGVRVLLDSCLARFSGHIILLTLRLEEKLPESERM